MIRFIIINWVALLMIYDSSLAQIVEKKGFSLSGQIQDAETKEPVPYASLGISDTTIGTAANEIGLYQIFIDPAFRQYKLKISCIGYETRLVSIDSLIQFSQTIFLRRKDILLDEIFILAKGVSAMEVMRNAIDSIPKNYYSSEFNMELYSSISTFDSIKSAPYNIESVLLAHYSGYGPNTNSKFRILEKRESGKNPVKSFKCGFLPYFDLKEIDLITSAFRIGVFNERNLNEFEFEYEGIVEYDKDSVYVISYYAPKPSRKIIGADPPDGLQYKGKIYITLQTNAVVRHTLTASTKRHTITHEIIYKRVNGFYFPYYIMGTRLLDGKNSGTREDFLLKNVITLRNVKMEDIIHVSQSDFCIDKIPFNAAFWDANYPKNK